MGRLRAALPLLLLLAAGGVLYASGLLDTLHPTRLAAHQEALHAQIARHPWLSRCAYVGLLTLAVATGLPGSVIIIFAGGLAFGVVAVLMALAMLVFIAIRPRELEGDRGA